MRNAAVCRVNIHTSNVFEGLKRLKKCQLQEELLKVTTEETKLIN